MFFKKRRKKIAEAYFTKPAGFLKSTIGLVFDILPFFKGKKKDLDKWAEVARERLKNPAKANFDLGKSFFAKGAWNDAITRFRFSLLMNSKLVEANFYIARAFIAKGQIEKAKVYLEKCKKVDFLSEEFTYFYEIYVEKILSDKLSDKIVLDYFNIYRNIFTEDYIKLSEYKGIEEVLNAVKVEEFKKNSKILELGCGDGFFAKRLKEENNEFKITGIDFQEEAIKEAKSLKINIENQVIGDEVIDLTKKDEIKEAEISVYDYLIKKNLNNFDSDSKLPKEQKYDLLVSRGFFNYCFDIKKTITHFTEYLNEGGKIIFYLSHKIKKEDLGFFLEEYSYPYFLNYYDNIEKLDDIMQESSFKKLSSKEFELEDYSKATIFIYGK